MKRYLIAALLIISHLQVSWSQEVAPAVGPYFIVDTSANLEQFPLLRTSADVIINGPMADVRVTQVYANRGNTPIEAVYVFPASTRAALYHMEMTIGDRTIIAVIQEKQQARETYEKAKEEGKRASLLEQHRPNVFQMNVANIMPGDEISIDMRYTEFLVPEEQVYQFVYPTVVGPRYTGEVTNDAKATFTSMPYHKDRKRSSYNFDIKVHLNMGIPIQGVTCSSHAVNVSHPATNEARLSLANSDGKQGNRDFILDFNLAGNEIETGVLTYDAGDEKFFLVQLEAPDLRNTPFIVPREYIFVLDVSGSMHGFPLDISKKLMRNLLNGLRSHDKFNIMFFSGGSFTLSEQSLNATTANISRAMQVFDNMQGGGGTNMLSALKHSLGLPKNEGYSRSYLIVTDGYVAVEAEAFELIGSRLGEANFFAFGIGSGVNRHLIEGIAHNGQSEPFIVTDKKEAPAVAARLKRYIEFPVMTDISLAYDGVELYDLQPASIPDLMGLRPVYVCGKFKDGKNPQLTISGRTGNEWFRRKVNLNNGNGNTKALSYLWAREKIRHLDDLNYVSNSPAREKTITELGLKYSLITKFTSFVAVDDVVVRDEQGLETVKQPLPLPQGVPNRAIGFEMKLKDMVLSEADLDVQIVEVDVACDDRAVKMLVETALQVFLEGLESDVFSNYFMGNTIELLRIGNSLTITTTNALPTEFESALKTVLLDVQLLQLWSGHDGIIITITLK
jgi:Ca-activated chloride channel family protein